MWSTHTHQIVTTSFKFFLFLAIFSEKAKKNHQYVVDLIRLIFFSCYCCYSLTELPINLRIEQAKKKILATIEPVYNNIKTTTQKRCKKIKNEKKRRQNCYIEFCDTHKKVFSGNFHTFCVVCTKSVVRSYIHNTHIRAYSIHSEHNVHQIEKAETEQQKKTRTETHTHTHTRTDNG